MKWCGACKKLQKEDDFHAHHQRGRQSKCKACQRDDYIRRTYSMTSEQASRYANAAICELCGGPPLGRSKQLDIDHDHETNVVRGFLCNRCNKILGYAQDDPARLRAAADYLERHSVMEDPPDASWVRFDSVPGGL